MANPKHVEAAGRGAEGIRELRQHLKSNETIDLSDAHLSGMMLNDADLRGANFSGADLSAAIRREWGSEFGRIEEPPIRTFLDGADLRGADFRRANLRGVSLCRADLREANLTDADSAPRALRYLGLGLTTTTTPPTFPPT